MKCLLLFFVLFCLFFFSGAGVDGLLTPSMPAFTEKLQSVTVRENDTTSIACKTDGMPRPAVTWSRVDGDLQKERHFVLIDGSLMIMDAVPSDHGTYVCKALNFVGEVEAKANLTVHGEL